MAKVKLFLKIEDADSTKQAVEIAQELVAMAQSRLKGTPHTVTGRVQIPCPDCGDNLTVKDGRIVCLNCEAKAEAEWSLDELAKEIAKGRRYGRFEPEQTLESLLL